MGLFKNLFKTFDYSPKQYYFPYFFNPEEFINLIKKFGLTIEVIYNEKFPDVLKIKSTTAEVSLTVGTQIMIDSTQNLIIWKSDDPLLAIFTYSLYDLSNCISTLNLNINELMLGDHNISASFNSTPFVTYVRKEDLKYNLNYYERYVLLIINDEKLTLTPFNWFNEKGGDYGYVWPATAQIDLTNQKLKGSGMRMADFEVDLYSHSMYLIS